MEVWYLLAGSFAVICLPFLVVYVFPLLFDGMKGE